MVSASVAPQHIIALIGYIQFEDQQSRYRVENKELLLRSLLKHRRRIEKTGQKTVSDAAVRGWFGDPPSAPRRSEALCFLRNYLLRITENVKPPLDARRQVARQDLLEYFVIEAEETGSLPDDGDAHRRGRLQAIAGLYQVYRPYVADPNLQEPLRYVLEPLHITEPDADQNSIISMYSWNKISTNYLYKGCILTSTRYCSAFMKRKHEEDAEHFSFRSISAYIDLKRDAEGKYTRRDCFSGIMMRGVQGNKGVRGPVAIPFVAIKSFDDPGNMSGHAFVNLNFDLHRLAIGSHVIIGSVDKSVVGIFEFCNNLFSNIRGKIGLGLVLNSVDPTQLQREICPVAENDYDYFASWKRATELYFKQWDIDHKSSLAGM